MESLLEFLNDNPKLNILFLILAFASIFITILTYYLSKRPKKLLFSKSSFNIVSKSLSAIEKLKIEYNNKLIEQLSVSEIVIYNLGKSSIRRNDIAEKDKLRIELLQGRILTSEIKFQVNQINGYNIKTSNDRKTITIDFDFMERLEGLVIRMFHTAKNDSEIEIKGTIIGGRKVKSFRSDSLFFRLQDWSIVKGKLNYLRFIITLLLYPIAAIIGFPYFVNILFSIPKEFVINARKNV